MHALLVSEAFGFGSNVSDLLKVSEACSGTT